MSNTRKRTWRPRFQSVKHRPEQNTRRVKILDFWWALDTCYVASQLGLTAWCWKNFSSPETDCRSIWKTPHKSCYDSQRIYLQGKKCQEHNHHRKNHNAYLSAGLSHCGVLRECTTRDHFTRVCGRKQSCGQALLPVTTRSLSSGHWRQHLPLLYELAFLVFPNKWKLTWRHYTLGRCLITSIYYYQIQQLEKSYKILKIKKNWFRTFESIFWKYVMKMKRLLSTSHFLE